MHALALRLVATQDIDGAASSDAALLQAAAKGDRQSFAALVRRHHSLIYRVVWRLVAGHADAEDITQEVFLRLWNNPAQLREAGALRGWLLRVANNLVMDGYRKAPAQTVEVADELADGRIGQDQALDRKKLASRIDAAVAGLPERQRLALTLVQFEHLSNREAAATLEITVDALESLLARARRELKQQLLGEWQDMRALLAEGN